MDPYLGEIRLFGGNFAPYGWARCDGQLLPISENDALYTLIGTTYGGDGESTFAVPDLRGRWPVGIGTSAGRTMPLGEQGGSETVTLAPAQMPQHTHAALGSAAAATTGDPAGAVWAASTGPAFAVPSGALTTTMAPGALTMAGGSQPHENRPPFGVVLYAISLVGVFPTQA